MCVWASICFDPNGAGSSKTIQEIVVARPALIGHYLWPHWPASLWLPHDTSDLEYVQKKFTFKYVTPSKIFVLINLRSTVKSSIHFFQKCVSGSKSIAVNITDNVYFSAVNYILFQSAKPHLGYLDRSCQQISPTRLMWMFQQLIFRGSEGSITHKALCVGQKAQIVP